MTSLRTNALLMQMVGSSIGHYRIVGLLGSGGMGMVYRAEDTRLRRPVAIKFLRPGSFDSSDRERLIHEAQNAALLQHPNICPVYDAGEFEGHVFFVMACLEGETLASRIRAGPLHPLEASDIAAQVAEGLAEAHRQSVIHRDVKSSNILVDPHGHAYILDFGLALRGGSTRLTETGHLVGTPGYMSPEQAQGFEVDHRSDVWSLGVVLFEMLTGHLPFERDRDIAVVHAIVHDQPPRVSELRPDVPAPLEQVVAKALAKQPENRWQSARRMGEELQRIVAGGSSSMPLASTATMRVPKPGSTRRWVAAGAMLCVLLLAVALWQWRKPAGSLPGEKHIAILPFEIIGSDEQVRAVADGLVARLTAQLSQLKQFEGKALVVPSSEIRSRKISNVAEARREYGVNLVLTGSAQRVGEMIQFSVTLVDAVRMRQLGARSFDFESRNAIALRDGALGEVTNLLEVQFSRETRGETSNAEAYAGYLQGVGYLARYDVSGNVQKALTSLEDAVRHDPGYALAYAALSEACMRQAMNTGEKSWSDRALETAERAVKLGPDLAGAHVALGRAYASSGREEDAIRQLQRALQLAPSDPEPYRELANVLTNRGRFTEAEALYVESTSRRPSDWYGHVLLGLFFNKRHRFSEAEASYKRAISLTPDSDVAVRLLGSLYYVQGRYPEAVGQLRRALQLRPSPATYNTLGIVQYYQRDFAGAAATLEKARDLDSSRYTFWGNLAMAYQKVPEKSSQAEPAFQHAVGLAEKLLRIRPKEYRARTNIAEYYARLGKREAAVEQLNQVPEPVRENYLAQYALVYELTGQRGKALEYIRRFPDAIALTDVTNDPDLQTLRSDPAFKSILQQLRRNRAR